MKPVQRYTTLFSLLLLLCGTNPVQAVTPENGQRSSGTTRTERISTQPGGKVANSPTGKFADAYTQDTNPAVSPLRHKASPVPAEGASSIYAWSKYPSTADIRNGLYHLDGRSGISLLWEDEYYYEIEGMTLMNGYLKDDKIIGQAVDEMAGIIFEATRVVYDFETGEVETDYNISDDLYLDRMTYDPVNNLVYATSNEIGSVFKWVVCPEDNWGRYEEICTLDTGLSSLCYNPVEGACFAIDHNKNFVRIEPDGFKSVISHIDFDFEPAYIGGLVYSPEDGLYYANVSTATESYILTITPLGAWDVYCELPGNNQLSFMFTTQEATTDTKRPEKPELKSFDFSKGAVSGSITYIMPSSLADGTPIDGTLTAVSLLDGVEYMTYEELPGETLKVDYENLESEMHYFGLYVVYEDRSSLLVMTTEYIGNDTPSAPADVHFENGLVTWSPVTDGIHDGYVDLDTLTYTVIINGVDYGTTAATELAVELPDAELAVYTASVYAEANGMKSAATVSNPVVHGHPFSLPMNIVPTADQAKLVTIIDGNQDGYFWYYDREYESFACDYSDEGVENDDWLIMPPFMADAESLNCILTFLVGNLNSEYPLERLEVYLGQTDKDGTIAMTQEIIAPFTPTEFVINGHQEVKAEFELPAPGTYYIGFHWISEPYQAGMEIKDICVKTNPNTGIQQTETLAHVTGKTGAVEITGCYGSHLRVRTVDGKTVLNTLITGDRISYPLEKGVYVISVDNRTTKAVIK